MTLIRPEVIEQVFGTAAHLHPLFCDFRGTPSGKIWHAFQLINPWEFYDPLGKEDDPEPVTPLHAQPVLELALRLPIHVLTHGGWDRAIARRAFYRELPREIANRTNKGGIERHVRTILENNIAYVREILLDGALVREGIVDKRQLTTALSGEAGTVQASSVALFDFIATEAWLRCWRNQGWRAAA
jgi:asparagine synthase (glutamine-hydrolysing)